MSERCKHCGSVMTFIGFDRYGARVTSCTASLGVVKEGVTDSAACNLSGDFSILGQTFKSVTWFQRRDDGPRASFSYARCRDHGLELAGMKARERSE